IGDFHVTGVQTCALPISPADLAGVAGRIDDLHRRTAGMPQRPGFVGAVDLADGAEAGGDVDLRAMPESLASACRVAWGALRGLPDRKSVVEGRRVELVVQ